MKKLVTYFGNNNSDWSVMMSYINTNTAQTTFSFFKCARRWMDKKKRATNLQQLDPAGKPPVKV